MPRKKASAARNASGDTELKSSPAVATAEVTNTQHGDTQQTSSAAHLAPITDVTKINSYNLKELKNTCDDTLKKLLSQPNFFQQQHTHTDVRLALGYLAIIIAAATALYGWKSDFEKSKPVVRVGVALYFILTGLQSLYAWFVEKDTIFVGKRKTFALRIETERLTVSSKTVPSTSTSPPKYALELVYHHSANGGKALLKRGKEAAQQGYNAFFDADGNMQAEVFSKWVEGLVVKATNS